MHTYIHTYIYIYTHTHIYMNQSSLVDQMVKNLPATWESQVRSLVGKLPWRREWLSTPLYLPGKFHGQRSPVGTVHGSQRVGHD